MVRCVDGGARRFQGTLQCCCHGNRLLVDRQSAPRNPADIQQVVYDAGELAALALDDIPPLPLRGVPQREKSLQFHRIADRCERVAKLVREMATKSLRLLADSSSARMSSLREILRIFAKPRSNCSREQGRHDDLAQNLDPSRAPPASSSARPVSSDRQLRPGLALLDVLRRVELRDVLADDLCRFIALDPTGAGVPARHETFGAQHVDRIVLDTVHRLPRHTTHTWVLSNNAISRAKRIDGVTDTVAYPHEGHRRQALPDSRLRKARRHARSPKKMTITLDRHRASHLWKPSLHEKCGGGRRC
jgi:hypothetical protein